MKILIRSIVVYICISSLPNSVNADSFQGYPYGYSIPLLLANQSAISYNWAGFNSPLGQMDYVLNIKSYTVSLGIGYPYLHMGLLKSLFHINNTFVYIQGSMGGMNDKYENKQFSSLGNIQLGTASRVNNCFNYRFVADYMWNDGHELGFLSISPRTKRYSIFGVCQYSLFSRLNIGIKLGISKTQLRWSEPGMAYVSLLKEQVKMNDCGYDSSDFYWKISSKPYVSLNLSLLLKEIK